MFARVCAGLRFLRWFVLVWLLGMFAQVFARLRSACVLFTTLFARVCAVFAQCLRSVCAVFAQVRVRLRMFAQCLGNLLVCAMRSSV
jgi:hypothetical protein